MKMICGFLRQTSGRISICDFDVTEQPLEAKRIIGYLPEGAPSYGEMTVADFLHFIARVRRLDKARMRDGFDYVVQELALQDVLRQPVETLSKGFKRRVGLAQALMHDPRVLIMDEPTDGLDPNQKHHVRALINSLSKDKIVVISTHILEEVSAVCTRALIIAHGRLLTDSTPSELLARSRYHHAVSLQSDDRGAVSALGEMEGSRRGRGGRGAPALGHLHRRRTPGRRLSGLGPAHRGPRIGPRTTCASSMGGSTRCFVKSPRAARHEGHKRDSEKRAGRLFCDAFGLRVHRHFPGAERDVHVLFGAISSSAARPICCRSSSSIRGCTCS